MIKNGFSGTDVVMLNGDAGDLIDPIGPHVAGARLSGKSHCCERTYRNVFWEQ